MNEYDEDVTHEIEYAKWEAWYLGECERVTWPCSCEPDDGGSCSSPQCINVVER